MNEIQTVKSELRINRWMTIIKKCRESGMPVNRWCKENNINQATYYKYLKKIREGIIQERQIEIKSEPTFIPVKIENEVADDNQIIITKGAIKIELSPNSNIDTVVNMIKVLLC